MFKKFFRAMSKYFLSFISLLAEALGKMFIIFLPAILAGLIIYYFIPVSPEAKALLVLFVTIIALYPGAFLYTTLMSWYDSIMNPEEKN